MAKQQNAVLLTTKKDWVKFDENYRKQIEFLDIELEFIDKEELKEELLKLL